MKLITPYLLACSLLASVLLCGGCEQPCPPPGQLTEIHSMKGDSLQLRLTWNKVDCANEYSVAIADDAGKALLHTTVKDTVFEGMISVPANSLWTARVSTGAAAKTGGKFTEINFAVAKSDSIGTVDVDVLRSTSTVTNACNGALCEYLHFEGPTVKDKNGATVPISAPHNSGFYEKTTLCDCHITQNRTLSDCLNALPRLSGYDSRPCQ